MKTRLICTAFVLSVFSLTILPYLQTRGFSFINYDDPAYVYDTSQVTNGFTKASVKWAFTDTVKTTSNWHPITFLSLMLDVEFFGVNPSIMHLHNAVMHAINAVLLFLFLTMLINSFLENQVFLLNTKLEAKCDPDKYIIAMVASFIGAIFWSVHPLRVESVAWISSRKDVLAVFWVLLGMLSHIKWSRSQNWRILIPFSCNMLAFMSKPTAIVFAPLIILTEYTIYRTVRWRSMVGYLVFLVVFIVVTISAQNAVITNAISVFTRLMNAVASLGIYIQQTIFPVKLTLFYPYEDPVPLCAFAKGALIIFVITMLMFDKIIQFLKDFPMFACIADTRNKNVNHIISKDSAPLSNIDCFPPCFLGLGWFLVALLPVIGIIHVGIAAHADRYTYLSGIGLSIILTSLMYIVISKKKLLTRFLVLLFAVVGIISMEIASNKQISYWRNSITVFTHANEVTEENHVAHCNLAAEYFLQKDYEKAFLHCRLLAAQGYPEMAMPRLEFLMNYLAGGTPTNQVDFLTMEVDEKKDLLAAHKYHALGIVAFNRKLYASAESYARKSIALDSSDGYVWELLGATLYKEEDMENALAAMQQAKRYLPKRQTINQGISIIKEAIKKRRNNPD